MDIFAGRQLIKVSKYGQALSLTEDYAPGKRTRGFHFLSLPWAMADGYPITSNVYHILPGRISGDRPWQVHTENGVFDLAVCEPGDPDYHYYEDWLQTKKALGITDEKSKEFLEANLLPEDR